VAVPVDPVTEVVRIRRACAGRQKERPATRHANDRRPDRRESGEASLLGPGQVSLLAFPGASGHSIFADASTVVGQRCGAGLAGRAQRGEAGAPRCGRVFDGGEGPCHLGVRVALEDVGRELVEPASRSFC
jgi:hypothetical protein